MLNSSMLVNSSVYKCFHLLLAGEDTFRKKGGTNFGGSKADYKNKQIVRQSKQSNRIWMEWWTDAKWEEDVDKVLKEYEVSFPEDEWDFFHSCFMIKNSFLCIKWQKVIFWNYSNKDAMGNFREMKITCESWWIASLRFMKYVCLAGLI